MHWSDYLYREGVTLIHEISMLYENSSIALCVGMFVKVTGAKYAPTSKDKLKQ